MSKDKEPKIDEAIKEESIKEVKPPKVNKKAVACLRKLSKFNLAKNKKGDK